MLPYDIVVNYYKINDIISNTCGVGRNFLGGGCWTQGGGSEQVLKVTSTNSKNFTNIHDISSSASMFLLFQHLGGLQALQPPIVPFCQTNDKHIVTLTHRKNARRWKSHGYVPIAN